MTTAENKNTCVRWLTPSVCHCMCVWWSPCDFLTRSQGHSCNCISKSKCNCIPSENKKKWTQNMKNKPELQRTIKIRQQEWHEKLDHNSLTVTCNLPVWLSWLGDVCLARCLSGWLRWCSEWMIQWLSDELRASDWLTDAIADWLTACLSDVTGLLAGLIGFCASAECMCSLSRRQSTPLRRGHGPLMKTQICGARKKYVSIHGQKQTAIVWKVI